MKIQTVKLQNIRSHENTLVEFKGFEQDGGNITLLAGETGCGKSTILMAIEFAIFGLSSNIKGKDLLRNTAASIDKKRSSGTVQLSMYLKDGTRVNIERKLKSDGTQSSDVVLKITSPDGIDKSPDPPLSVSELRPFMQKLLGIKERPSSKKNETFRSSMFIPQQQVRNILASPAENREMIRHIFDMTKYGIAIDNINIIASELKKSQILLNEITSNLDNLRGEILKQKETSNELEKSLQETLKKKTEAENIVKEATALYETVRDAFASLLHKKSELEKVQMSYDSHKTKLDSINIQENRNSTIIEAEMCKVRQNMADEKYLKERLDSAKVLLDKHQEVAEVARSTSFDKSITTREEAVNEHFKSILDEYKSDLTDVLAERDIHIKNTTLYENALEGTLDMSSYKAKVKAAEVQIEKLADEGVCDSCGQTVSASYRKSELEKRNVELSTLQEDLSKAEFALGTFEKHSEKIEFFESNIKAVKVKIDSIKEVCAALKICENAESTTKSPSNTQQNEILLNELQSELDSCRQAESLKETLENEILALESYRKEIAEIENNNNNTLNLNDADELKNKVDLATSNLSKITGLCGEIQGKLESSVELYETTTNVITKLESRQKLYENDVEKSRGLGKLAKALVEIETSEMASVGLELEQAFQEIYKVLMPHIVIEQEQQQQQRQQSETGESTSSSSGGGGGGKLIPSITQDFAVETPHGLMSGGEQTATALAYRLALHKVMRARQGESILILDEPSDGMSAEQVSFISKAIRLAIEPNTQVIMVSHDNGLQGQATEIIHIIKHADSNVSMIDSVNY